MSRKPLTQIIWTRFLLSIIFVFAVYNTWGYSYYNWVFETAFEGTGDPMGVLKILAGFILGIVFFVFFYSAFRAYGSVGILLTLAVFAGIVWLLQTLDWINILDPNQGAWTGQVVLAFLMTVGSTWSITWRRFTGQFSVEDPDTDGGHDHDDA